MHCSIAMLKRHLKVKCQEDPLPCIVHTQPSSIAMKELSTLATLVEVRTSHPCSHIQFTCVLHMCFKCTTK